MREEQRNREWWIESREKERKERSRKRLKEKSDNTTKWEKERGEIRRLAEKGKGERGIVVGPDHKRIEIENGMNCQWNTFEKNARSLFFPKIFAQSAGRNRWFNVNILAVTQHVGCHFFFNFEGKNEEHYENLEWIGYYESIICVSNLKHSFLFNSPFCQHKLCQKLVGVVVDRIGLRNWNFGW